MISMGESKPKRGIFDELFERDGKFEELFDAFVKRGREKMELGREISQLRSEKRNEINALRKEISALKKENRELKGTLEDAVHESEEADGLLKKLRQNEAELRTEKLDHMSTVSRADGLKGAVEFYQERERVLRGERDGIGLLLEELYIQKLERDAEGHETVPGREWKF